MVFREPQRPPENPLSEEKRIEGHFMSGKQKIDTGRIAFTVLPDRLLNRAGIGD